MRLGCVFEDAIGHTTFIKNLACQMEQWPDIVPLWHTLPFTGQTCLPASASWTLRSGLLARAALRRCPYDALLFHTHLPALLCPDHLRSAPTLLSMDATPAQNARLGIYAGCSQRHRVHRALNALWTRQGIRLAYRVVAWSDWVRRSLVEEYGVSPDQVVVLPPGINVEFWRKETQSGTRGRGLPRILFVGGDLRAKGGELLLQCYRRFWQRRAELHLVTRTPLGPEPGVFVHNNLGPNSPGLVALFREADIFALPTFGDTFAQVVLEAMASGLPVVASDVGAISELVSHGETGLLVPPRDRDRLFAAVEALLQDTELRRQMGQAGQERACEHYNIARNGRRMVDLLRQSREGQA